MNQNPASFHNPSMMMVKQKQMANTLQGLNSNNQQLQTSIVNRGSGSNYSKLIPENLNNVQRTQSNNHHHRVHVMQSKQKMQALNSDSRVAITQPPAKQLSEDNQVQNLNKSFN